MTENQTTRTASDGQCETPAPVASDGFLSHLRVSVIATLVLAIIVSGVYPLVVWGLAQALFPHKANGSLITDKSGKIVGSELIGQGFSAPRYFHPRPSAAGNGYDPTASGGSNFGPTNAKYINGTTKPSVLPTTQPEPGATPAPGPDQVDYDGVKLRILLYAQENNIAVNASQPLKNFQNDKGEYDQVKLIKAFNDDANPLTIAPATPIPADAVTASGSGLDPHISVQNAILQAPRVAAARKLTVTQVEQYIKDFTEGPDLGILGEPGVNVLKLNLKLDEAAPVATH